MKKACPQCGTQLDFSAESCACGHVFKRPRLNVVVASTDDVAVGESGNAKNPRVNAAPAPANYRPRIGIFRQLVATLTWPFRAIFGGGSRATARTQDRDTAPEIPGVHDDVAVRAAPSAKPGAVKKVAAAPAAARTDGVAVAAKTVAADRSRRDLEPSLTPAKLKTTPAQRESVTAAKGSGNSPPIEPTLMGARLDVGASEMAAGENTANPNDVNQRLPEKPAHGAKPAEPATPRKVPSPEELAAQFAAAAQRGEWAVLPPGTASTEHPQITPGASEATLKPLPAGNAGPADSAATARPSKPSAIVDEALRDDGVGSPRAAGAAKGPALAPPPLLSEPPKSVMDKYATDTPAKPPAEPVVNLPETRTLPPTPPPAVAPVPPAAALPMEKAMSSVPPENVPGPTPRPSAPVGDIRQTMVFGRLPTKPRVEQQAHYLDALDSDGEWSTLVEIGPQGVTVGRTQGQVTLPVPSLGASHARFTYDNGHTVVFDLGARNGVMLKLQQPVRLKFGQRFRVGGHLLELRRFERSTPAATTDDSARDEELCTRELAPHAALVFIGLDGSPAFSTPLLKPETVMGRDLAADVPLVGDSASSRRHAALRFDNGEHWLEDLGSQNGTFLQIAGQERLRPGDTVALGVLLFRVADKETKR